MSSREETTNIVRNVVAEIVNDSQFIASIERYTKKTIREIAFWITIPCATLLIIAGIAGSLAAYIFNDLSNDVRNIEELVLVNVHVNELLLERKLDLIIKRLDEE